MTPDDELSNLHSVVQSIPSNTVKVEVEVDGHVGEVHIEVDSIRWRGSAVDLCVEVDDIRPETT